MCTITAWTYILFATLQVLVLLLHYILVAFTNVTLLPSFEKTVVSLEVNVSHNPGTYLVLFILL